MRRFLRFIGRDDHGNSLLQKLSSRPSNAKAQDLTARRTLE